MTLAERKGRADLWLAYLRGYERQDDNGTGNPIGHLMDYMAFGYTLIAERPLSRWQRLRRYVARARN